MPIGLTMIGSVIFRDSVTTTDGGGGSFSSSAVAWQPATPRTAAAVAHEQPKRRTSLVANLAAG